MADLNVLRHEDKIVEQHDVMEYDVIIVGGGPSGLAAAIRLKQLAQQQQQNLSVCILEKGAQIGAHNMGGAVLEPRSLQALLPDLWKTAPLDTPVTKDYFYLLSQQHAFRLPTPLDMQNDGNYIISIGNLCQFLAKQAEALGCEIYPGFAAAQILFDDHAVVGVATGDLGIDKNGNKTANHQPGMHLKAKQTLFAEGCRGELSQKLMKHFELRLHCEPQTYAIGLKEIWTIPKAQHHLGTVIHTIGWPLTQDTYGGAFIYHAAHEKISLGLVIGLDYTNPWLNPFQEFQRFKTHPMLRKLLQGGERVAYGSRALNEGGWQSIPKLSFPGGMLVGDSAGFMNVAKIKGIHTAMQSGITAAETTFELLKNKPYTISENIAYDEFMKNSWVTEELYKVRNIRPGFRFGLWIGLAIAAFETYITRGKSPWTLHHHEDHTRLKLANQTSPISYPQPDGIFTYDLLSSVYLSNTYHEENQPCHLKLRDKSLAISVNYQQYASPETRYCPAGVYEIIDKAGKPQLQINAQNCLHCKTCDIKDPKQNIKWTAPEGAGGPNYVGM